MRFLSYFVDARKTIMANKMRSGLSTLGIVIGMASVVVMMAIGHGTEKSITKTLGEFAKNKISISSEGDFSSRDENNDKPGGYVQKVTFTKEIVPYIEHYFPELSGRISYQVNVPGGTVKIGKKSEEVSAVGVPPIWFELNEKKLEEGSFFSKAHYEEKASVAVINGGFRDTFFKTKDPLGKKFIFNKKEFTIVGVLKKTEFDRWNQIYIPDTTAAERILHKNAIDSFDVLLDPQDDNKLRQNKLAYLLLKKYNKLSLTNAGFNISSFAEQQEEMKKSLQGMKMFLLAMGAISLLVGGIGVMNIMIVSVTERTREIWIRKAIGALNKDIIVQFLVESVVITLIWGFVAFLLSYGIVYFVNKFLSDPTQWLGLSAEIDQHIMITTFFITTCTGIVFGILPARKAAKLKPIDALRFE